MRKAERKLDTPPPECASAAMPYLLSWSAAVIAQDQGEV